MSYEEIHSKVVKVRKKCICTWCGELINIGDMAQSRAFKFDGDFHSDRIHPECFKAMQEYDWNDANGELDPYSFKRGTINPKVQ